MVDRPGDRFASLDLATLGSAHVLSRLSCFGSVTSEVVGLGWTHVTGLRTVGVGSPGLASLTPLSGGGSRPSRGLFFVILSPLRVVSDRGFCVWQSLRWVWRLRAIVGANSEPLLG